MTRVEKRWNRACKSTVEVYRSVLCTACLSLKLILSFLSCRLAADKGQSDQNSGERSARDPNPSYRLAQSMRS